MLRSGVATVVWLLTVLAAVILAAGALVIALGLDRSNPFVDILTRTADELNFLGVLKDFEPEGSSRAAEQSALVKTVLVSWGVCAVVYLVIGKLLERIVRP